MLLQSPLLQSVLVTMGIITATSVGFEESICVSFVEINKAKRTDNEIGDIHDLTFHKNCTKLSELIHLTDFDFTQVPNNYMHSICLGIVEALSLR